MPSHRKAIDLTFTLVVLSSFVVSCTQGTASALSQSSASGSFAGQFVQIKVHAANAWIPSGIVCNALWWESLVLDLPGSAPFLLISSRVRIFLFACGLTRHAPPRQAFSSSLIFIPSFHQSVQLACFPKLTVSQLSSTRSSHCMVLCSPFQGTIVPCPGAGLTSSYPPFVFLSMVVTTCAFPLVFFSRSQPGNSVQALSGDLWNCSSPACACKMSARVAQTSMFACSLSCLVSPSPSVWPLVVSFRSISSRSCASFCAE